MDAGRRWVEVEFLQIADVRTPEWDGALERDAFSTPAASAPTSIGCSQRVQRDPRGQSQDQTRPIRMLLSARRIGRERCDEARTVVLRRESGSRARAARGAGARRTVHAVDPLADQWVADVREVQPRLMRPSGDQRDLDQRVPRATREHAKAARRTARPVVVGSCDSPPRRRTIGGRRDCRVHLERIERGDAVADREILLVRVTREALPPTAPPATCG